MIRVVLTPPPQTLMLLYQYGRLKFHINNVSGYDMVSKYFLTSKNKIKRSEKNQTIRQ